MTDQRLGDATLEMLSTKLRLKFADAAHTTMKELEDAYGARVSMSLVLMTIAEFSVLAHIAAGMDKETVKELLNELIDDVDEDQYVDEH